MNVTVYVVVTYHGGYGDEVQVFGTKKEAEACVMEYAKEYWNAERLGRFPRSYAKLYEAWRRQRSLRVQSIRAGSWKRDKSTCLAPRAQRHPSASGERM